MVITVTRPWLTLTNQFWAAATLSMITLRPQIHRRDANTCHLHPHRPCCWQQVPHPTFCARLTMKRTSSLALPLPAQFWPSGDLLLQTILAHSFLWETTVLFFLDDSNTVWSSRDFHHNLHIFLCLFIFVMSLQLSTDIVFYGSVVFSVSVWYLFLCGIFFCMKSFDNFSFSFPSISSAIALPVSRGRHGKLVDNFSHESDVTSLQDPFTSCPYQTPFYFYYCVPRKIRRGILLQIHVEYSPSPRLLVSALAVYATAFRPMFHSFPLNLIVCIAHATPISCREDPSIEHRGGFSFREAPYFGGALNSL